MAKTLSQLKKEVHVAQIINHGEQLILPEGMGMEDAISLLKRRQRYLEEEIEINYCPMCGRKL